MKKLFLNPVIILLLTLTTMVSCKDDDEKTPNRTSLLTSKEWKVSKLFADGQDFSSSLTGFDYRFKFNTNNTYSVSVNQQSENGTWEFTANEQKIIFDKGTSDEYTADILLLDANSFNMKFEEDDGTDTYMVELRMIH